MDTPACPTRVIASAQSWIEGEAVRQLQQTASLPGMQLAVGMPDLHPGRGTPIGAAFASAGVLFPFLVGSDIGCGMGLWQTDLSRRKVKRDRWVERLRGLEGRWSGAQEHLLAAGLPQDLWPDSMGTIGSGNHFAEVQQVEEVADEAAFTLLGLEKDKLLLMVHSGSRGLGEEILRRHTDKHAAAPLHEGTEDAIDYLAAHDQAVKWASANRAGIAHRILDRLSAAGPRIVDINHNFVAREKLGDQDVFVHRKGAAPTNAGPVVIPGSRGALSYLVLPTGDGEKNLRSLAHGAGRKYTRHEAKARLRDRYRAEDLVQTALGSAVICEDRDLLFEEAPEAYKKIDQVVGDLVDAGVAKVVATFRPVITYKMRAE